MPLGGFALGFHRAPSADHLAKGFTDLAFGSLYGHPLCFPARTSAQQSLGSGRTSRRAPRAGLGIVIRQKLPGFVQKEEN